MGFERTKERLISTCDDYGQKNERSSCSKHFQRANALKTDTCVYIRSSISGSSLCTTARDRHEWHRQRSSKYGWSIHEKFTSVSSLWLASCSWCHDRTISSSHPTRAKDNDYVSSNWRKATLNTMSTFSNTSDEKQTERRRKKNSGTLWQRWLFGLSSGRGMKENYTQNIISRRSSAHM